MKKATFITTIFLMLGSCSKHYHERKFYQKGGVFNCVPEIIQRTDTIMGSDGKDSLIYCYDTIYKPQIEYVPKWKVRFDNKRFDDSLDHIASMYQDSLTNARKSQKIDNHGKKIESKQTTGNKLKRLFTWLIVGVIIGFIIRRYARF